MAMSSAGDERILATLHTECHFDNSHIILNITRWCPWRIVILTETILCATVAGIPYHIVRQHRIQEIPRQD